MQKSSQSILRAFIHVADYIYFPISPFLRLME